MGSYTIHLLDGPCGGFVRTLRRDDYTFAEAECAVQELGPDQYYRVFKRGATYAEQAQFWKDYPWSHHDGCKWD